MLDPAAPEVGGFPLLKLVAVFSLAGGVLLDYVKGNQHQHELALLRKLLDYVKPRYLPNTLSKRVPEELSVRVLRFTLAVPGFRPDAIKLVTTLTDARAYPAHELARLYARRWRIELWFRDLKTTLGMETLRGQSPRMLHKELEMYFIAYNLLRALMVGAAAIYEVPVEQIRFKGTVDATLHLLLRVPQPIRVMFRRSGVQFRRTR